MECLPEQLNFGVLTPEQTGFKMYVIGLTAL